MVLFLLHNTLGAWWAGKVLAERPEIASEAESEDELRKACAVGNVTWPYLRFVREDDGLWRPAAGAFDGWPKMTKEITVLDPSMGSGHFLVFALPILVAFRMAEEGLSSEAAFDAVLRDNLFGLEIDARCTQIAAFYLALAAWRVVGHRPLPRLNLACSGLSLGVSKAEWVKLAERAAAAPPVPQDRDLLGSRDNLFSARVKTGLERLYDLFARARWLGSLIDPRKSGGDVFAAGFSDIEPFLAPILAASGGGDEVAEMAVTAQGMAKAAELLGRYFTLVTTNVPYLGRGKQDDILKEYCERAYRTAKADIATCFVERCLAFTEAGGTIALVTPQNWLFLGTYKSLREKLLKEQSWNIVARLGERGFESSAAAGAFTALLAITRRELGRDENSFIGLDVSEGKTPADKNAELVDRNLLVVDQRSQLRSPDAVVSFVISDASRLLGRYAECFQGISPGDTIRLVFSFWEIAKLSDQWRPFQGPPSKTQNFGGRESVVDWEILDRGFGAAAIRGRDAWGKQGIAIGQMRELPATLYEGSLFSNSTPVIIPKDEEKLILIWAFCQSGQFTTEMRKLNPKVSVDNGYVSKIPFDLGYWEKEAERLFPNGLPQPHSIDPTQWLFHGNPKESTAPLLAAVARLLGYRWPRQTGSSFPDCPALDVDGLEEYADADGIVCIPAVRGEEPAADRLGALLAAAFGFEWSPARERQLIVATGSNANSLDDWLRTDFYAQHCALFHHRPFIWHVWDGRKDGFHALISYHKLAEGGGKGRKLLEALTYSYLGDWIGRQKAAVGQGVAGADDRLAAAIALQKELERIIAGDPPYDIFVRWKPLHEQPIGWEPDINDGVRLNIRPFMSATLSRGRTGAGVLRAKPNIKWHKDRGKEPGRDRDDYPWFWNGEKFTGERHNDRHFTNAEKRAARQRRGAG